MVVPPPCNFVKSLCLEDDFIHGAYMLNSGRKKNELLIKMRLDNLLYF